MCAADKRKGNLLVNIWLEKCPNCGQARVFKKPGGLFKMPQMHEQCPVCHYKFYREPGYFLGAMYISYGIAVLMGILTYLILYFFFPGLPLIGIPLILIAVVILIAKKNYRLSRIIYMHMFPW
jgi:hypothetical protein